MPLFDPPPGFDDLLGDCDAAAGFHPLEVDGVGTVLARKPLPNALGDLAMSQNPTITPELRSYHASRFTQNHLAEGEYTRLLTGMLDDDLPAGSTDTVSQALATWGTARSYNAVIILSFMAAKNWRAIRYRLLDKGITDPMAIPSIHPILDETEQAVLESYSSDNPDRDKTDRDQFQTLLYKPDPRAPGGGSAAGAVLFDAKESSASFNSLAGLR